MKIYGVNEICFTNRREVKKNVRIFSQKGEEFYSIQVPQIVYGTLRPFVISPEGIFGIDYERDNIPFYVSPDNEIISDVKLRVRKYDSSDEIVVGEKDTQNESILYTDILTVGNAMYLFSKINFLSFSDTRYHPPMTKVLSRRTSKEYKTIECVKDGDNYVYIAIPTRIIVFSQTRSIVSESFGGEIYLLQPVASLANVNPLENLLSINFPYISGEVFTLWLTNDDMIDFISAQSYGVVPTLLLQPQQGNIFKGTYIVFSSPFIPTGYTKLYKMKISGGITGKWSSSFSVGYGTNYRVISSSVYIIFTTTEDTAYFDIFYRTTSNLLVKGGMAFFEGGNHTNGFCGVNFTYGNLPNIRVVGKASVVNSTMYFDILKYQLPPMSFSFEKAIQKNSQTFGEWQYICDLPKFPRFLKVLIGNVNTNEWVQDDISHFYHHTNLGGNAVDMLYFGGANTKRIIKERGVWKLFVKLNGIYNAFGPNDINYVKVFVW